MDWSELIDDVIILIASFSVNKQAKLLTDLKLINKHWNISLDPNKLNVNLIWENNICRLKFPYIPKHLKMKRWDRYFKFRIFKLQNRHREFIEYKKYYTADSIYEQYGIIEGCTHDIPAIDAYHNIEKQPKKRKITVEYDEQEQEEDDEESEEQDDEDEEEEDTNDGEYDEESQSDSDNDSSSREYTEEYDDFNHDWENEKFENYIGSNGLPKGFKWRLECPVMNLDLEERRYGVYYCKVCKENVYQVKNVEELGKAVDEGKCIQYSVKNYRTGKRRFIKGGPAYI